MLREEKQNRKPKNYLFVCEPIQTDCAQAAVKLPCSPGGQGCLSLPEQLCQLSAWTEGRGHGSQKHRRSQQEAAD